MSLADPAFLALLTAACLGLTHVLTQFGLRHMPPAAGASVSIPTTAIIFWLLSPFLVDISGFRFDAIAVFVLVGLFYPALATRFTFEANERLGPTVTATIGSTAPLFAVAVALLFLGEHLTLLRAAAIAATVAGVALVSWQPKGGPRQWSPRILLLPFAVAVFRGVAQPLAKIGMALWPSPFAAGLIGYTVSAAVVGTTRPRSAAIRAAGIPWFALIGLINGTAMVVMYMALNIGAVTVVAPIVATYPLFALLFSAILLRDQRLGLPLAAGAIITVAGVAALLIG
jgi:uncharacterized membrane protein